MFLDVDTDPQEPKSSKVAASSDEPQVGQKTAFTAPGVAFPGNPFDFSAMSGLLNV